MCIKKLTFMLLCVLMLSLQLTGCGSNLASNSDYPYYTDDGSLLSKADVVVAGEVIKVNKADKININADKKEAAKNKEEDVLIYTVSDVKVTDVIKGNVKIGDIIKIKQLGDKDGKIENEVTKHGGYFKESSQNIFFLESYENIVPGMPYSTLNPMQGHIEIIADKAKVNQENKLFKDGTSKEELVKSLKEKVKTLK